MPDIEKTSQRVFFGPRSSAQDKKGGKKSVENGPMKTSSEEKISSIPRSGERKRNAVNQQKVKDPH